MMPLRRVGYLFSRSVAGPDRLFANISCSSCLSSLESAGEDQVQRPQERCVRAEDSDVDFGPFEVEPSVNFPRIFAGQMCVYNLQATLSVISPVMDRLISLDWLYGVKGWH